MCYPERRGLVSLCGVKAACSGDLCTGNGHRGKNWSLDILSRAFFNGPELTSRISRFAPDQLTQATGESKLPSFAKEARRGIRFALTARVQYAQIGRAHV